MPCENSARKRNKTMAFRCTPEEHMLICELAAWSGTNRQDYIIAKLTDTQVEVKPSVSVQKALKDSMAQLAKEVSLVASYGELSESLQQRVELVMGFFGGVWVFRTVCFERVVLSSPGCLWPGRMDDHEEVLEAHA